MGYDAWADDDPDDEDVDGSFDVAQDRWSSPLLFMEDGGPPSELIWRLDAHVRNDRADITASSWPPNNIGRVMVRWGELAMQNLDDELIRLVGAVAAMVEPIDVDEHSDTDAMSRLRAASLLEQVASTFVGKYIDRCRTDEEMEWRYIAAVMSRVDDAGNVVYGQSPQAAQQRHRRWAATKSNGSPDAG